VNPNRPPVVYGTVPDSNAWSMGEATNLEFSVSAGDPNGGDVTYAWEWDGAGVGSDTNAYDRHTAWGDAGTYCLRCYLSDDLWPSNAFAEWTVTVLSDNDQDGMPNAYENLYGPLNPWDASDATNDADNDYLLNLDEYLNDCNPTNFDTDADTMGDGWELASGLNPKTGTGDDGPDGDPDTDGMVNYSEYLADTYAKDSNSLLRITNIVVTGGGIRVDWQGGVVVTQFLERTTNLAVGSWGAVFTNVPPTPTRTNWLDADTVNSGGMFYRVKTRR
jgi:hypothetical protein